MCNIQLILENNISNGKVNLYNKVTERAAKWLKPLGYKVINEEVRHLVAKERFCDFRGGFKTNLILKH